MNLRRNLHGWLLWLALILPIAQAMAGVHALSHLTGERQELLAHRRPLLHERFSWRD